MPKNDVSPTEEFYNTVAEAPKAKKSPKPSLVCPSCGNAHIYEEDIVVEEWKGGIAVHENQVRYTCLNLECGHIWTK